MTTVYNIVSTVTKMLKPNLFKLLETNWLEISLKKRHFYLNGHDIDRVTRRALFSGAGITLPTSLNERLFVKMPSYILTPHYVVMFVKFQTYEIVV